MNNDSNRIRDAIVKDLLTASGPKEVTNADIVNAHKKGGLAEKISRKEKAAQTIKTLKGVGKNKKQILEALVNNGYKIREARAIYQEEQE